MKDYNVEKKTNYEMRPFFDDLFGFDPVFEDRSHSMMRTDITENENNYDITIDLPSVKKEDVKISFDKGYLTVSVEQKENKEENEKKHYIRKERYYGCYSRSYYFGENVSKEDISAKMENGVLNVNIKKATPKENTDKYIDIM